jgi:hypothetical protein
MVFVASFWPRSDYTGNVTEEIHCRPLLKLKVSLEELTGEPAILPCGGDTCMPPVRTREEEPVAD